MIRITWKRWLSATLLGVGVSLVLYACASPNDEVDPTAKVLERASNTPAMPKTIEPRSYLTGYAAKQVAIDRLDEVEYYADRACDDEAHQDKKRYCSDYGSHCPFGADYVQQFVTAIVTDTSRLTVSAASLKNDGTMSNIGSIWQDTVTPIEKVAVVALDRRLFAVGILNTDKSVTLRVFNVGDDGPTPQALFRGAALSVSDFAMARVPVRNTAEASDTTKRKSSNPIDTEVIKLAIAYTKSTDSKLEVVSFDIDRKAEPLQIQRQSLVSSNLSSAKVVAIAAPQRPQGVFVTASVGTDGKVTAVSWTLDDAGLVTQGATKTLTGTFSAVAAAPAGYRRVALYAKGSTSATLASLDINNAGASTALSLRSDIVDNSAPLTSATLVSGGSSRLYLVGKSGADLKIRSYLSTTDLQALDERLTSGYGASSIGMAAAVFESSWLLTAGVNPSTGQVRVNSWRDYHVPVARGFWPLETSRVPIANTPSDNKSTFSFNALGSTDLSIAASDKYIVTCEARGCKFYDKAGNDLDTKYAGATEYKKGRTVYLSSLANDVHDSDDPDNPDTFHGPFDNSIFDSAVGVPGVTSKPVAEESLLRHLEYQHACDPELRRSERNRCPYDAYDSSVTYDTALQRFVIVTNFRFRVGCSDLNGRYPAVAISATTDPRDGFFTYAALELGGRDMPRISAQNGMAVVSWNAGGDSRTLGATAEVWNLNDLKGTLNASMLPQPVTAVPRVTKIDRTELPPTDGAVPVSARGDIQVGMLLEQTQDGNGDYRGGLWTFQMPQDYGAALKRRNVRYPFELDGGDEGAQPAIMEFKEVGTGLHLYDGHLYRAGGQNGGGRLRVIDYNFRYKSDTNDLWLAGAASQQFNCPRTSTDKTRVCPVFGVAVDDKGRVLMNYMSASKSDVGSEGYPSASYALLQRPTAPPITAVLGAGGNYRDPSTINTDFALPLADPTNEGFWTIANRATTSGGFAASAGRVMPDPVPNYAGIGRLWLTDTSTQPAALGRYPWQDNTLPSTWRQVVHGDFDGGSGGLEEIFAYDDKAGTGRFYSMSLTGMQLMAGGKTGLGSALYVVALEVCGGSGNLCPGSVSNTTRELLFYDWVKGERSLWRVNSNLSLSQVGSTDSTSHNWSLIVAGDFTSDAGEEVIFYNPLKGEFQVNELNAAGSFVTTKSNTIDDVGGDATAIVSGDFDTDALDEIYVYTPYSSKGRFYKLDSIGTMAQVGPTRSTRGTWTSVATIGQASSVLVHYDAGAPPDPSGDRDGTLLFTKITNGTFGTENEVAVVNSGNRRNWSQIVVGDFVSEPQKEMFFYRQIDPGPATSFKQPTGCSGDASYILPGEGLGPNQFITSCNGQYRLIMQLSDGNLVLYKKVGSAYTDPQWASATNPRLISAVRMESGGDFAMYDLDGARVWGTNTDGNDGVHLKLYDTGQMTLYSSELGRVWGPVP